MPITTRSGARNDVSDMYNLLLSSVKATIGEGADLGGTDSQEESSDDNVDFGDMESPVSRATGCGSEAMLATPASAGATGESDTASAPPDADAADELSTETWPLAEWEHQVSMPKPAAATASKQGVADWTRQKAQPAANAHAPIQDARKAAKASAKVKEDTAGPGWFGMKAQPITEEVKRDWRLLRLRAAYDPKKFYKTFDSTKIPKYFQRGTVIEGTGEFYSSRLTRRERKQTLAEELAADIKLRQDRKRRYARLQAERQEVAKKRKKARALHKRSKHRPKH